MADPQQVNVQGLNQFKNVPLTLCTTEQLMWLATAGRALFAEYAQRDLPVPAWFDARYNAIDMAINQRP